VKEHRRTSAIAVLRPNLGDRWGGWATPRPGRFTPEKSNGVHWRKLSGPKTRLDGFWRREYPLSPRIEPRIFQCVASRYTDYAFPTVLKSRRIRIPPCILVDTDVSHFVYRAEVRWSCFICQVSALKLNSGSLCYLKQILLYFTTLQTSHLIIYSFFFFSYGAAVQRRPWPPHSWGF